jgi:hypothetical protein
MHSTEVIYLMSSIFVSDSLANKVETFTVSDTPTFANEIGVESYEHYNAATMGIRPVKAFEIYSFEYNGESRLTHNDTVYKVERTSIRGDKIKLFCSRVR